MSWQNTIKKEKPPDEFSDLTSEDWETRVSFNDISLLALAIEIYVEDRQYENDDEHGNFEKLMEYSKQLRKLGDTLEGVLMDTRKILLDKGM
tara:strand:- start:2121 stop:2396 length:276 start_codon:yes stop_codon:yes gene_type:complete